MKKFSSQDISLFKFIIAVTVVLILIMAIVNMNLSQKSVIDEVSFSMAKQNFNQNTGLIRAQWLLEGRPKSLIFNFYMDENNISGKKTFNISNKGWPLIAASLVIQDNENACHTLWRSVNNLKQDENIQEYLVVKYSEKDSNNKKRDISCHFCDVNNNDNCIKYSSYYGVSTQVQ